MVPQLHIHIIARFKSDRAWPEPIWGTKSKIEFTQEIFENWSNDFLKQVKFLHDHWRVLNILHNLIS